MIKKMRSKKANKKSFNTKGVSFLGLVKQISESTDDETEGLDFDDEDLTDETPSDDNLDDFEDYDDMEDYDEEPTEDEDTVTVTISKAAAKELIEVLKAVIDEESDDELEDDLADDELEDDLADDESEDDIDSEDDSDEGIEEEEEDMEDTEDEAEEKEEEELDMSSSAKPAGVDRNGAPKRSKANTSWNTGKTVKSVYDKTASGEGEPAGVSRDGAPKRSKANTSWNNSKTVNSKLTPPKNIFDL